MCGILRMGSTCPKVKVWMRDDPSPAMKRIRKIGEELNARGGKQLMKENLRNIDKEVVSGFGDEWARFDQSELSEGERMIRFEGYFSVFPWHSLPDSAEGFDLGCGSGRWAALVAPRVGLLHCIDPSSALDIARKKELAVL